MKPIVRRWFVYILWNAISWTVIHWKRNMKRWPSWYQIISNLPFSSTQYNNILVNAVVQYKHIFLNGNLYECIGEKLQLPSNYIVSLFRLFSSVLSCSSFISTYILLIHIFNLSILNFLERLPTHMCTIEIIRKATFQRWNFIWI